MSSFIDGDLEISSHKSDEKVSDKEASDKHKWKLIRVLLYFKLGSFEQGYTA